ncbi:nucleotide-diphospho-sugar transferase [Limtongia smithiae]|uniref:nucleotide-diphospho-sugar transferase n=1 Tax=Limtongia smithiae TaxID=1125753 RepID=UPI0034CDE57C
MVAGKHTAVLGLTTFIAAVYLLSLFAFPEAPRAPVWHPIIARSAVSNTHGAKNVITPVAATNASVLRETQRRALAVRSTMAPGLELSHLMSTANGAHGGEWPRRQPRYAVASSVMTARFAQYAMMLAYTLQQHNDFEALDAELILLVRTEGKDAVTAHNITNLEKVGWRVLVEKDLEFEGVDKGKIRPYHRYNLNKLYLWSYTQYERIVFIDADTLCKNSIAELFVQPGDIAGSPDVWWDVPIDTRFNSGVISFRPSIEEFRNMITAVSDPEMHKPNDADQAFLNAYYRRRFHALPFKYNYNLVMYQFHRRTWDMLWDEAVIIHYTTKKPMPTRHCGKGCGEWEPSVYYSILCKEMLAFYGLENELPVLG